MTEPPQTPSGGGPDWGEMKGKVTAARGPDLMILVGAAIMLVDSFLPWYGACALSFCANVSGWNTGFLGIMAILCGVAAGVYSILKLANVKMNLSIKDGQIYMILGIASLAFVLLRFVTATSGTTYGLYIAIVAGAVLAYAGFMKNKSAA